MSILFLLRSLFIILCKRKHAAFILICCIDAMHVTGNPYTDTPVSSQKEALHYMESIGSLQSNLSWPGINPQQFLQNIKDNISNPLNLYEGTNTNFCGYAALSYILLHDDPLQYAKFMVQLYQNEKANWGSLQFKPSHAIMKYAGMLKFKGRLDVCPADQLWFLTLADHFKGYLNIFDHHYDPGNEDTFWAAVNYSKFNNMIQKMSDYNVTARGSDLIKPWINDLYDYLSNSLKTGITVLYLNNTVLHKKNHNRVRAAIPTHYIILLTITETEEGLINMTYWDYGFRTLRQIRPVFLRKIVFGVSHCIKRTNHVP